VSNRSEAAAYSILVGTPEQQRLQREEGHQCAAGA
jgi:hypothetical protein